MTLNSMLAVYAWCGRSANPEIQNALGRIFSENRATLAVPAHYADAAASRTHLAVAVFHPRA
jgi:hypothetical protein